MLDFTEMRATMRRNMEHITWLDHEQDGPEDYTSVGTDSLRHTFIVVKQTGVPPAHRYLVFEAKTQDKATAPTLAKAKRLAPTLRKRRK